VLDGLSRVYSAAGKTQEYHDLAPKIQSLKSFSEKKADKHSPSKEPTLSEPDYFEGISTDDSVDSRELAEVSDDVFDVSRINEETGDSEFASAFSDETFEQAVYGEVDVPETPADSADEFEIEVEFEDFDVESAASTDAATRQQEVDWLDSVGEILESISTPPSSVKFDSSLDGADAQSHYDLGMAFKEMGLYDEAINEFRQASADPERRVGCIIFQGSCLRDKGDVKNADNVLRSLLKPDLSQEDFLSTKYELALTCKAANKDEEFALLIAEIEAASPGYRDIRSLIATIGTENNDLEFSEEDFKNFEF
jgi:tetratricopeptide (TPR) repeat protein